MDVSTLLSGIAVGACFGFVLQRGRFCLHSAFRNAFHVKDFTPLRTYVLALTIALIASHLIELSGIVHLDKSIQQFTWIANSLGGYLFGIGMVLAGGDAAGTWYRTGEGMVGSLLALLGIMIGASTVSGGVFSGIAADIESVVLSTATGDPLTIPGMLGVNKWVVIAVLTAAGLVFVFSGPRSTGSSLARYSWKITAVLVGLLIALGLFVEQTVSDTAQGLTFIDPSGGLLRALILKRPWDWGVALVTGVLLGSFASATGLREFSWRAPRADALVQQFTGGLIMGAGGMLAGGCSIGHGLTGMAMLAVSSLVSLLFIILGSFTMYLLFKRRLVSG